jgi:hypothetical protein
LYSGPHEAAGLVESEVGPYPTAIEAEWVPLFIRFGHRCRWTQQVQRFWGYTVPHQFFNSSRCGHVNMVIDPSAFKESVAARGLGFPVWQNICRELKAERYERGISFSRMRSRGAEGYVVAKSNRIHGGGWPLESRSLSYTGRARL